MPATTAPAGRRARGGERDGATATTTGPRGRRASATEASSRVVSRRGCDDVTSDDVGVGVDDGAMYLPSARAAIRGLEGRTDLRERQGDDRVIGEAIEHQPVSIPSRPRCRLFCRSHRAAVAARIESP